MVRESPPEVLPNETPLNKLLLIALMCGLSVSGCCGACPKTDAWFFVSTGSYVAPVMVPKGFFDGDRWVDSQDKLEGLWERLMTQPIEKVSK